jgi:DNA-binding FrmR family transcriptional regulator
LIMKTKAQRLNNIIGQIKGIQKMIESGGECLSVLTQLKAVKSGVSRVMDEVVEEQLNTCMDSLNVKDRQTITKIKKYLKA